MRNLTLEELAALTATVRDRPGAEALYAVAEPQSFLFDDRAYGAAWVAALEKCAAWGLPEAYVEIGTKYNLGWGVAQSAELMLAYYKKAADAGHGDACYFYALQRAQYLGLEDAETETYLLRCLQLNAPKASDAALMLGRLYLTPEFAGFDVGRAVRTFELATERGAIDGFQDLSGLYYTLDAGVQDLAQAFHWVKLGAEAGQMNCQFNLGLALLRGIYDNPLDPARAEYWLKKCYDDHGYEKALTLLVDGYLDETIVPADPADQLKYVRLENDAAAAKSRAATRQEFSDLLDELPPKLAQEFDLLLRTDKLANLAERMEYLAKLKPHLNQYLGFVPNVMRSQWAVVLEFNQRSAPSDLPAQVSYTVGLEYEFGHREILLLNGPSDRLEGMNILNAFGRHVKAGNELDRHSDYSAEFAALNLPVPVRFRQLTRDEANEYGEAFHWYIRSFYAYLTGGSYHERLLVLDLAE